MKLPLRPGMAGGGGPGYMPPTDYSLMPPQGAPMPGMPGAGGMQIPPGMQAPPPGVPGGGPGGGHRPALMEKVLATDEAAVKSKQEGINRQRKIADMLRAGAGDQMKGQMVSGHYVGPSDLNLVSNIAQQYVGQRQEGMAGADQNALGQGSIDAARGWFERLTGGRR